MTILLAITILAIIIGFILLIPDDVLDDYLDNRRNHDD